MNNHSTCFREGLGAVHLNRISADKFRTFVGCGCAVKGRHCVSNIWTTPQLQHFIIKGHWNLEVGVITEGFSVIGWGYTSGLDTFHTNAGNEKFSAMA